MSRVRLPRQQLSDSGLTAAYSPASSTGHAVPNDGKLVLHVRNAGSVDCTVSVRTGYVRRGLRLENRQVVVAGRSHAFIGPLEADMYNQIEGGIPVALIDYSAVQDVTVAALQMS